MAESNPSSLINPDISIEYWSSVDADNNGMLGGYPQVSRVDLIHSKRVLSAIIKRWEEEGGPKNIDEGRILRAAEGGAGIGRITKGLLLQILDEVDVIEPIKKFTDVLRMENLDGLKEVHNVGLQDWTPTEGRTYTVIWVQWSAGHLKDEEFVEFLKRSLAALQVGGRIVVKENVTGGVEDIYDEEDSSITRTEASWKRLFQEAGLKVEKEEVMRGIPRAWGLFPIVCWILRP